MDSNRVEIKYFKFIGLWQFIHPDPESNNVSRRISFLVWLIFSLFIMMQLGNNFHGAYNFTTFIEKLSVNITCFESAIKIGYYYFKVKNLQSLTSMFSTNILLCSRHDENVTERIMTRNAQLVNASTKGFVYMIFTTVAVWNSLPVFRCLWGDCSSWNIMPSWYPMDATQMPICLIVFTFEFFVMIYCAALLYTVNCLFYAIALSIGSQFNLLTSSFSRIEQNADKGGSNKPKPTIMSQLLRECIIDHQKLLRITKELETMYSPMFIFQMLTSTFTICLVLVQLNEHLSNASEQSLAKLSKYMMYLTFGSMELLVYSWGGQIIYDSSGQVHRSLYESGWETSSVEYRKSIIIAMIRSLKPEFLTAGKYYRVDLASFTQVIKASYSYFTFLHRSENKAGGHL